MSVDSVQHHGEALAEALSDYLEYTVATQVAEEALGKDGGQFQLIGMTGRGLTAVFYSSTMGSISQKRYDPEDLGGMPGVGSRGHLETVRSRGVVEQRLLEGEIAAEWIWVHPRWRWAVEKEASSSGG